MSKYEELRECLIKSKTEYNKNKTEAYTKAKQIYEKLRDYYEVPSVYIQPVAIVEDQNADMVVTLSESLVLLDDFFWHFGIGVVLFEKESDFPHETVQIHIQLKKNSNGFVARLGDESPLMNVDSEAQIIAFLDFAFIQIKEEYSNNIKNLAQMAENVRRIGFK